jgi:hypothetical protein
MRVLREELGQCSRCGSTATLRLDPNQRLLLMERSRPDAIVDTVPLPIPADPSDWIPAIIKIYPLPHRRRRHWNCLSRGDKSVNELPALACPPASVSGESHPRRGAIPTRAEASWGSQRRLLI